MIRILTPATRRALPARRAAARGEDGFILLESIVALSLISVILAALGTFAINSVTQTNQLRARQGATQVATTAMTTVDSLPTDDLLTGRDASSANTASGSQWYRGLAIPAAAAILNVTSQNSGVALTGGATAAVSTATQSVTLNGIAYSLDTYIGKCVIPTGTSDCGKSSDAGITYNRVVVWVTWKGRGCLSPLCSFATSSLVSQDPDPVFNTNKSTPPATPIVANPGNQTSTVGGAVALTLAVKSGTGVNPMTWAVTAGTLPLGLTLGTNGTISGTPTSTQAATSVTVTVTDAFTRTGSATFTWAVLAAPTITTPAAQTTRVGASVSLSTTSTCPNSPCTYAAVNLPAGLSINSSTGAITGSPTTVGTSSVTVTVTDAANVSASTNPFTWTVTAAARPTVSNPGTRNVTIGQVVSVPITFTCPTGSCTVTLTNTVPGLGLTGSSTTTGNNTLLSGTVSATSGTIYIGGTVQSSAVPSGSSKTWAPVVTISDGSQSSSSAAGAFTAYVAPTISALAAKTVRVQETSSVALTYTCPVSSCTITLAGTVTGLGLATAAQTTANNTTSLTVTNTTGTIYYTGKVDPAAVSSGYTATYNPAITITDSDTVAASTQATYTVNKAPAITNPGTQTIVNGQSLALQLQATCPNGGCTGNWSAAVQYVGDSTWYAVTIDANGKITQSNYSAPSGDYTVRVILTDSAGKSDTIYFTLHVVSAMSVNVPDQTTTKPATGSTVITIDASKLVSPTADGYTYTLSGQPSWLSIDSTTGLMTATITSTSASDPTITLTVRSNASSTSTAMDNFSWTLQ